MKRNDLNVFAPHPDLSSRVDLDVPLGVVIKTRSGRSLGNLLNEARALWVWSKILDAYNDNSEAIGQIASPELLRVGRQDRELHMTFRPGLHLGKIAARDHGLLEDCLPLDAVREDIAFRLGSLAGIKAFEGFIHGDYQQRHLLYVPLTTVEDPRRLSVIDVESSRPAEPEEVQAENDQLLSWFRLATPKRLLLQTHAAYQDGFSTAQVHTPAGILKESIDEAVRNIR